MTAANYNIGGAEFGHFQPDYDFVPRRRDVLAHTEEAESTTCKKATHTRQARAILYDSAQKMQNHPTRP